MYRKCISRQNFNTKVTKSHKAKVQNMPCVCKSGHTIFILVVMLHLRDTSHQGLDHGQYIIHLQEYAASLSSDMLSLLMSCNDDKL